MPSTNLPIAVERRIARLERQNRWLRRIGLVALIVVGSLGLSHQVGPAESVRTRELVLVDADDAPRAVLNTSTGVTALAFYDAEGEVRVRLALTPDGPVLAYFDEQGEPRDLFRSRAKIVPLTR